MPRTKPPFRADHVGSLLRPAPLKAAREKRERGEITAAELAAVEDREIEKAIRKQEDIGLRSATDGEFRRAFWNYDFLGKLPGVEAYLGERKIKFQGAQPKPMMLRVVGKLDAEGAHPMIEHFKFVAAHAKATPKMTIPSPSSLHFRYGRDAVPASIYPVMEDFYRDLGESYRAVVRAFAGAGCRYLQLDEVNFAYLCDPKLRAFVAERGDDPKMLPHIYARMINAAISDVPPDMTKRCICAAAISSRASWPPAATSRWPKSYSTRSTSTPTSWNTTATAPAASSRCASCPRARWWCSASSPPSAARSRRRTRSSAASTRRRNSSTSTSSAFPRNAASPRARKAISWPRTSNGRSCGGSWRWRMRCGDDVDHDQTTTLTTRQVRS